MFAASDRPVPVLRSLQQLLGNGRLAGTGYVSILPVDQGIEHSAGASFAKNPAYFDPENIVKLAIEGGCNAVASTLGVLGVGRAQVRAQDPVHREVQPQRVPLLSRTRYDQIAFARVEQAADMGAVAVGATIYFGSEESTRQIQEVGEAFQHAHELGMATVLWCYLRNPAFKTKEKDYHVSADLTGQANHLGVTLQADIIKQKLPENNGGYKALGTKESPYGKIDKRVYETLTTDHPIDLTRYQVANCYMGRAGLINSGGASGENDFAEAVKTAVINKRAGGMGLISGRKAFQRPHGRGRGAAAARSRTCTSARTSRSPDGPVDHDLERDSLLERVPFFRSSGSPNAEAGRSNTRSFAEHPRAIRHARKRARTRAAPLPDLRHRICVGGPRTGGRSMTRRCAVALYLSAMACGSPTGPTEGTFRWSTPVFIADVTRLSAAGPSSPIACVAATGDGEALAFWLRRGPDADEVWARTVSSSDVPGPPVPVQGSERLPRVNDLRCTTTDEAAEGYVSWIELSNEQVRLVARRITRSGLDATPVLLDQFADAGFGRYSRFHHDLAVSGARAIAVWQTPEGTRAAVAANGAWTHAGLVSDAAEAPVPGAIGVDVRDSRGAVAYVQRARRDDNGSLQEAWVRLLDDSGRLGPAVSLGWGRWVNFVEPLIDEAGHVMVASVHMSYAQLVTISRWRGAGWTTDTTDAIGPANDTLLFVGTPDGTAVALRPSGREPLLGAARWAPGQATPALETVSDSAPDARDHVLAFAPATREAHAAWVSEHRPWLARSVRPGDWQVEPVPGARPQPAACPTVTQGYGASSPQLVFDGRTVLVAWIDMDCGRETLYVQRRIER